ncbi:hypothetical protein [Synechococcus sp. KORDI-52]|uniref:hypothetical protein n=1 Tax=Synechococcus sp. KORDI-52 TaxID=585425 RepID=UPI0012EBFBF6|nr:hypothetical protein [Synechococcus sp. KORDI-52]
MQFKVQVTMGHRQRELTLNAENEADVRRKLRSRGYSEATSVIEQVDADCQSPKPIQSSRFLPRTLLICLFLALPVAGVTAALFSEPFDPDVCKTEAGRLRHLQQCVSVLNDDQYAWSHRDLSPDTCKRYLGSILGHDPSIMRTVNWDSSIVRIDYTRQDDGKKFMYECSTLGDEIIWRGVDIFRLGDGPGRWRYEDARSISNFQ